MNQRGGIISKVFLIPIGFAFAVGFFILGYYVGRYQTKEAAQGEKPPALPEMVSEYLPKKEEFTFYKTLTEKGEKNVSIDLKPKPKNSEEPPVKKEPAEKAENRQAQEQPGGRTIEIKLDKPAQGSPEKPAAKPRAPSSPKEAASKPSDSRLRYTIQVASYPEKALAEDEVRNMKQKGYAAFLVTSQLGDKGVWYRVRVGSFSNKASAEKLANELRTKAGVDTFITVE